MQVRVGCQGLEGRLVLLRNEDYGLLTRLSGTACGKTRVPHRYRDCVAIGGQTGQPETLWTLVGMGSKCALRSNNGMFVTLCHDCWSYSTSINGVFVQVSFACCGITVTGNTAEVCTGFDIRTQCDSWVLGLFRYL